MRVGVVCRRVFASPVAATVMSTKAPAFREDDAVFEHPVDPPAALVTKWFRLEMLAPPHNERDHEAWMSSIEHIHATPGFAPPDWGDDSWPTSMTLGENLADLEKHSAEFLACEAFAYSVLDGDDVIGCVYIDPRRQWRNGGDGSLMGTRIMRRPGPGSGRGDRSVAARGVATAFETMARTSDARFVSELCPRARDPPSRPGGGGGRR